MALDKEHKYVNQLTQEEHDDTANVELKKVGSYGWDVDNLEWQRLSVDTTGNLSVITKAGNALGVNLVANDVGIATNDAVGQLGTKLDDANTHLATIENSVALNSTLTSGDQVTQVVPRVSGGLSTFHLVSEAGDNATVVKASSGQLYGWYIYNSNSSARKVAFHDSSSTPTAGASVLFSIIIPPTGGANAFSDMGIAFTTGIGITTVTELADSGSTAVGAEDLIINLFYF